MPNGPDGHHSVCKLTKKMVKIQTSECGTIHCIITQPLIFKAKILTLTFIIRNNLLMITQPLTFRAKIQTLQK